MKKILIDTGRFILVFIGANVMVTSLLLLANCSISSWNFPFSYIVTALLFYFLKKEKTARYRLAIIDISIGIIFLLILFCTLVFDVSYDGNWYHKLAAGFMKQGWNPIYDNISEYYSQLSIPAERINNTDLWITCYPKASWYFAASVYAMTNNIETAKCFNMLIFYAVFMIALDYFSTKFEEKIFPILLAFIFASTPVAFSQFFTNYIDCSLGSLLFATVIILMSISDKKYRGDKNEQFLHLAICIIICSNLKMTGLVFEGVFCAAFFVLWCVEITKEKKSKKIARLFIYYIVVLIIALLVVGAGSYLSNFIHYGNPFYPVLGSDMLDFSDNLKVVGLSDTFPVIQMIVMIFIRVSGSKSTQLDWKIPFTFRVSELQSITYDTIRGGAGVFFSGILCLSMLLLLIVMLKRHKTYKEEVRYCIVVMTISIALLFVMPAGGQARYSPYLYLIPNCTIYLCLLYLKEKKSMLFHASTCTLIGFTILNSLMFSRFILTGYEETKKYEQCYAQMSQTELVLIDTELPGIVFNFIDKNIAYKYETTRILDQGEMKYLYLTYELVE